jgi:hypothetical protein
VQRRAEGGGETGDVAPAHLQAAVGDPGAAAQAEIDQAPVIGSAAIGRRRCRSGSSTMRHLPEAWIEDRQRRQADPAGLGQPQPPAERVVGDDTAVAVETVEGLGGRAPTWWRGECAQCGCLRDVPGTPPVRGN